MVCGCAADERRIGAIAALGVADSKVLAPAVRRRLAGEIRRVAARVVLRVLPPEDVDAATRRGGLNAAEAAAMVSIIREVNPELAVLDGLTSRPGKFGREVAEALRPLPVRVISESRADGKYPLVQAASIIAKVTRDDALDALREAHGDIGSGYPGDPRTIAFLRRCLALGEMPPFVRRSWRTVSRLAFECSD